jgi:hypothetical protein
LSPFAAQAAYIWLPAYDKWHSNRMELGEYLPITTQAKKSANQAFNNSHAREDGLIWISFFNLEDALLDVASGQTPLLFLWPPMAVE